MISRTKPCFVPLSAWLLLVVLLGSTAHLAQAQPTPALELLSDCSDALGGNESRITIRLVRQNGDWQLIAVTYIYSVDHDIDLTSLASFKAIESLDLFLNRHYDPKPKLLGIESISKLPKLRELDIKSEDLVNGIDFTNAKFNSIEWLRLRGSGDAIMSKLSAFPHLKKLSAHILSKSATSLRDSPLLESLEISTDEPIDDAIPAIAELKALRSLDISGSQELSESGIMKLSPLSKLTDLEIYSVNDKRIAALESLPALENFTCVFEGKQADLRGLRRLKSLHVPEYPRASTEVPYRISLPSSIQKISCSYQYLPVFEDGPPTQIEIVVGDNGLPHNDKNPDWSWLKTLPNLKHLTISIAMDADVEVIAGLKNLETLIFDSYCAVFQDETILKLKGLKKLKHFQCEGIYLTEKGVAVIENFENLERLNIAVYESSAEGLDPIFKLKKLRSIHLQLAEDLRGNLDGLFQKLASLDDLEEISIPGRVTDEGLTHLLALTRLRHLYLSGNSGYTNAGLANLMTRMPSLQEVTK